MNIMDFLSLPMLFIGILFTIGTILESIHDNKITDFLNLNPFESKWISNVITGIVVILILILYVALTHDTPDDIDPNSLWIQVGKGIMYYTMFCSWVWVYECYSKGFMKRWSERIKELIEVKK